MATKSFSPLPHNEQIERLVLWKDPKVSGGILVGSTVVYYLLLSSFSVAWLLSTLSACIVVISLLWSQAGPWFKSAGPPVPKFMREGVSEDEARQIADLVRQPVNKALAVAGRVLCGKDVKLSGMIVGGLSLASYVFHYISLLTLSYSVVVLAFTLPKLYEVNKEQVDAALAKAKREVLKVWATLEDKVRKTVPSQKKAQ